MDENALKRFAVLMRDAIVSLEKHGGDTHLEWPFTSEVKAVTEFIDKTFAAYSVSAVLELIHSVIDRAIALRMVSVETRQVIFQRQESVQALTDAVCKWWDSIPRRYRAAFPMIEMPTTLVANAEPLAEGLSLDVVELDYSKPVAGLGTLAAIAALSKSETKGAPALIIEPVGLINIGLSNEIAAATAIRECKAFLMLSAVSEAIEIHIYPPDEYPRVVGFRDLAEKDRIFPIDLPDELAKFLARANLPQREGAEESARGKFSFIGRVIEFSRRRVEIKNRLRAGPIDSKDEAACELCERVVTASVWAFDAEDDGNSVRSFVQNSIAFEALYGGGSHEPIVQSISNRLAFSLGKTAQERKELQRTFGKYYEARSQIVHLGQSRLSRGERELLRWGRTTLRRGLERELQLIADVGK